MLLGAVSVLQRRPLIPISAADLSVLDREGARGLNNVAVRTMKRARDQLQTVVLSCGFLLVAALGLNWSASGLLAYLAISSATQVLIDVMRLAMARRWISYCHQREHRTEELLQLTNRVARGDQLRPVSAPEPQEQLTITVAVACTLICLPALWCLLTNMGWTSVDRVWNNYSLPILMLGYVLWRLLRAYAGIRYVKGSTVGARTLCLESDDALDNYALAAAFAVLMLPLGASGAMALPFLIVVPRLIYRSYRYWWLWRSLRLLSRRVHHQHDRSEPVGDT